MDLPNVDLAVYLTTRLKDTLPGEAAQARFSPRLPRQGPFARETPANARQAAALILLYPRDQHRAGPRPAVVAGDLQVPGPAQSYAIPLTLRRTDLPDHAGQISLPGGRIDDGETAVAAALREAEEEIGVDPSSVRILGSLTPLYVLVSRFVITPFVGVISARPTFRLAEREVSELLEIPLDQLRDRDNLHWGHRTREGYLIDFPYFNITTPDAPHDQPSHQVWGATAMILGEFISLIDNDFGPRDRQT